MDEGFGETIGIVLIVVLLVIGGAYFFYSGQRSAVDMPSIEESLPEVGTTTSM